MSGMSYSYSWLLPTLLLCYTLYTVFSSRFASSTYDYLTLKGYERVLRTRSNNFNFTVPLCPSLPEYGYSARKSIQQNGSFWSLEDIEFDEKLLAQRFNVVVGGSWSPVNCNPVHQVAIILPFRGRSVQLKKFLVYMHGFLQLQLISYKIVVVEQKDELLFNRGKLLNIGYHIAAKNDPSLQCFIFHDVDLLPESLYNIYGCAQRPRHLSAVVNTFRYTLMYPTLFGGAAAMTKEVFQSVNGFSNNFYGWGGEDDDLYSRLLDKGVDVIRLSPSVSSYRMLPHKREPASSARYDLLQAGKAHYNEDGLSSLKYSIVNHIAGPLYTIIQVQL